MRFFYPTEYKILGRLAVPVIIGQMGLTLQNLADNVMVGQHSTAELAAAGFINNLFMLALLLMVGFATGAVSQIGALYARGSKNRIVEVLRSSLYTDVAYSLLMCLCLVALYVALPYMGQPEELIPLMRPYLVIQVCSLPFMAVSTAYKQFTDSVNDTSVAMGITLIGNVWNIVFNYLLIFGRCGFPEMGIEGAAWATFSSRVLMFILAVGVFFLRPKYKEYVALWRTCRANQKDMLLLNRLGWPISIQMGMEVASFTLVAIFLGWLGTNVLAAHQVMLSITNLIFMFYLGIATAVAIRVSNHNGHDNIYGVREAAFAGWQMIFVLGVILSSVAYVCRNHIATLFTDEPAVSAIVATLILPLILYQLGDGIQTTFVNALRGLGDVKKLVLYSVIAYLIISLPLSYVLGIVLEWGAFGIWMAFPFGLSTAAILYLRRFLWITNHKQYIHEHSDKK
ncbi:MAG: MATE family efflux transporter [Bacteroidales bacterium]|nr:MATE family efflux transporter [Bacteroidales bacterium]